MGLHFSRIWERMFGKREMRILMVGLDAAGKVSLLVFKCFLNVFECLFLYFFTFSSISNSKSL